MFAVMYPQEKVRKRTNKETKMVTGNKVLMVIFVAFIAAGCSGKAKQGKSGTNGPSKNAGNGNKQVKAITQKAGDTQVTYKETVELFNQSGYKLIELVRGQDKMAICPKMGGRVVAITWSGDDGVNPFFVNPVDVKAGPEAAKLVFRGGLGARDWLGPEGCGDMSFYFHKKPMVFENWYVDKRQNLPDMKVEMTTDNQAVTAGEIHIPNLRGNEFDIGLTQKVILETNPQESLGVSIPTGTKFAAMARTTSFKNIGNKQWDDKYGYAMIWFVAMQLGSDDTYIIMPYKGGNNQTDADIITDYKFDGHNIPADRLIIRKNKKYIIYKADGRFRGKTGLTPQRTTGICFSINLAHNILAVLKFDVHPNSEYLDNTWTSTPIVSGGDALNTYVNMGDNPVLPGRFFEMEAVSPRLGLKPGETFALHTTMGFFQAGSREILNKIVMDISGCDISDESFTIEN